MKKLEKKEMMSIQGGIKACGDLGGGLSGCVYYKDGQTCAGIYRYDGSTVGIYCN